MNGLEKSLISYQIGSIYLPSLLGSTKGVISAQTAFFKCVELKNSGFTPDLIIAHSGWGQTMFMRDVFPHAKLISYFEWYFEPRGYAFQSTIHDPDVGHDLSIHDALSSRVSNLAILQDLVSCDVGVVPTNWQKNQFPSEFLHKLHVIHEGIDTTFFSPSSNTDIKLNLCNKLNIPSDSSLLTYTTRAFEPMRGFPSFFRAAMKALSVSKNLEVLIVGDDSRVCYGANRTDGVSYKDHVLSEFQSNEALSRIHFIPPSSYAEYLTFLQASDCHVYLTKPYVLSWSFLEALSCQTPVVARYPTSSRYHWYH